MTDHHLKTISFIADIGDIIVVMARLTTDMESKSWSGKMPDFSPQKHQQEQKTTKVICHVLETAEVGCSCTDRGGSTGQGEVCGRRGGHPPFGGLSLALTI